MLVGNYSFGGCNSDCGEGGDYGLTCIYNVYRGGVVLMMITACWGFLYFRYK